MSVEPMERARATPATKLKVLAPLSGQIWPLERVPDPVFAQKLVGDGLSIDPTDSIVLAPCDGEVIALHAAGHAVTLRTNEGLELLIHVGIDTVTLKGEGFQPRVKGNPELDADGRYTLLGEVVATACGGRTPSWRRAWLPPVAGEAGFHLPVRPLHHRHQEIAGGTGCASSLPGRAGRASCGGRTSSW